MPYPKRLVVCAGLAAALGGCTTFGTNIQGEFTCRAPKGGCAPSHVIDAGATAVLEQARSSPELARVRAGVAAGDTGRTSERTLKIVFPAHVDVVEDPFILKGKGSAPFDDEGVLTRARHVVSAGEVQGYFLSSYSARKLGMRTTGHAGGSQNLQLTSRLTQPGDDLDAMLRKLDRGLFVIELMGQGVNYVTGDYSRGAAGFWVEGGKIVHPVHEVTIAGNLRDMLKGIVAVGSDAYTLGSKTIGSVLVERMKVAGA